MAAHFRALGFCAQAYHTSLIELYRMPIGEFYWLMAAVR